MLVMNWENPFYVFRWTDPLSERDYRVIFNKNGTLRKSYSVIQKDMEDPFYFSTAALESRDQGKIFGNADVVIERNLEIKNKYEIDLRFPPYF